jgi:hypothetical protein
MPLLIANWSASRIAVMVGIELMCLALLAGFWLPSRIGQWAFRGVAGLISLAYAAYFIHEFFFTNAPFRISGRRSEASPFNALLGFIVIGLPCLVYAVLGRFTLRAPAPNQELEKLDAESDDHSV